MKNKLYTGRGDDGTTLLYGGRKRIKKNACSIEALGEIDELNSFIGWCRATVKYSDLKTYLAKVQQDLFIMQAEIAGANKQLKKEALTEMERIIEELSKELPKINSFIVSGETAMTAMFDVARTIARRVERRVVSGLERKEIKVNEAATAYLNRLSSLLYAMARLVSKREEKGEKRPNYR